MSPRTDRIRETFSLFPGLNNVDIRIRKRKEKSDFDLPMYGTKPTNKTLGRLLFGLGKKQDNYKYTMNLVRNLLGHNLDVSNPSTGGYVQKSISLDEDWPYQLMRSIIRIDEDGRLVDNDDYPFTFYAVVHADKVGKFIEDSKNFDYDGDQDGYDDLLDSPDTEVYVHSISSITSEIIELARRNADVRLIINEKIADYIAYGRWS